MRRAYPKRYVLRGAFVTDRIDLGHRKHKDIADELGLSRSYWSQVVTGRRDLSPDVRQAILDHPLFAGVPESELWDIHPPRNEQLSLVDPNDTARGAA